MKLAPKNNWRIRAKNLYENLGFEYTSIDNDNDNVEKNEDSKSNMVMDINFDQLEKTFQ
jgi:hypothetical protein